MRSSAIHGIDHRASGTAVIYRQPDGSLVVGLEDIDIQPGPDYDVYVVPGADREDTDGGIRLDDLRGNKGTQYYPVPTGTDVATGAMDGARLVPDLRRGHHAKRPSSPKPARAPTADDRRDRRSPPWRLC